MRLHGINVMYQRPTGTIVVRDRVGNRIYFTGDPPRVLRTDTAAFAWYGRVDFRNRRRFTRFVRSALDLEAAFARLPAAQILDSGWEALPIYRSSARRIPFQGMERAIQDLQMDYQYDGLKSATSYAAWVRDRQRRRLTLRHEWCHLLAHSMGGMDRPANVVAAGKGNNSEQLAIENILSAYRSENIFQVRVQAGLYDQAEGKHLATVIRYQIKPANGNTVLILLLDATVSTLIPSAIHQYTMIRNIGTWLNSRTLTGGGNVAVDRQMKAKIRKYLKDRQYDVEADDLFGF